MKRKVKPRLELRIRIAAKICIVYPAKSVSDARQVRAILSPPDGNIPYSQFELFVGVEKIEF